MPGIFGLVTKLPRKEAEPQLLQMMGMVCHENFYVSGTLVDEKLGVYVGWVARKNSFSDGMPLQNGKRDAALIFAGEEFSGPDVRGRLRQRGRVREGNGPSYLLHMYEDDPTFPACLNGWFHGLLTDRSRKRGMLFNDRYGMHRLYYHESKQAFYFAAEAKAILAVCPELRRTDPQGLGEYVACGCVMENRTFFEGIQVLPPGSSWAFHDGAMERKSAYFEPREWEQQSTLEPEAYYQEIKEVFSRCLPRYFAGNERIGMSLTGGLDSRMIMAWQKPVPGSLPCYTFGGMFRDCRDVAVARQVATMCEQSHDVITVGEEFLSRFPYYAERAVYLTDGSVDMTYSPDLYLNERVRELAPVRMTGNYGSEVFRLHVALGPTEPAAQVFAPEFLGHVRRAGETYDRVIRCHPLSFAVFRQAPWHHYNLLALEQTQLSLRSPYLDNDLVRTVFRAPPLALASSDVSLRLIADGDVRLWRIPTDRGLGGGAGRFSARVTRSLLEFLFKAEYAYDYGMPQWVARIDHLLSPLHLERLFIGRHKFHHFRIWYRDALSSYVREMLLDPRTRARPYLDPRRLESIVARHLKGDRNYTAEIHKLLNLELLHRLFLDPK